jgi:hypothetical protein
VSVTTVEFDPTTPADEHSKATRLYEAFVVACSEHGVTPEVVISVEVNFLRIRTPLSEVDPIAEQLSDEALEAELARRRAS